MINLIPVNLLRFLLLLVAQVLVFSNINVSPFINIYVYPLFILLLPFETPKWLLLLLGLGTGLAIDVCLGSLGLHASAGLLLGYVRPFLINIITPKGTDFEVSPNIKAQGFAWFLLYSGLGILIHHSFYFLVESGTFYNLFLLLFKILLSSFMSLVFILVFVILFSSDKKRRA